MRTQEEIKQICEEIQINVQKAILKEERTKAINRAMSLIKKHKPDIITGIGIVSMIGSVYGTQERLLRAQSDQFKMNKAFEDYKQKVEERL